MDYQALVEGAMKDVVRNVLLRVAKDGLPGEHHLYITFQTKHKGVEIADRLVDQYPDEMTIVLQYQFWGLEIFEDAFEITLSFSGNNERLYIPIDAVIGFADPSVNFGLQFKTAVGQDLTQDDINNDDLSAKISENVDPEDRTENKEVGSEQKVGEVVALDAFRKNKNQ
ncbi:MAG: hypothetical protein CFH41_01933 [Alphaproteobacteria bacterium MarineAlpha11_Bin1]|nr:MAG: hypothetical protein CFH41_01933 [Alphaproteobacteria bacterium MarineAlpha11_Bin1]